MDEVEKAIKKEPLSTTDPAFLYLVSKALNENKELLILHRPAYMSGGKQWYIAHNQAEFDLILATGRERSSFSVVVSPVYFIDDVVSAKMKEQIEKLWSYNEELLYVLPVSGQLEVKAGEADKDDFEGFTDIYLGKHVLIGPDPGWDKPNSFNVFTAYVPDADGVVRPGAY